MRVTAVIRDDPTIDINIKGAESFAPVTAEQQQFLIGVRAGCFGLSCIIGIMAGIYLRTHDLLSPPEPTLNEQFAELVAIGFSPQESRQLLVPGSGRIGATKELRPPTRDTVLFSIPSETCDKIDIDRFVSLATAAVFYDQVALPRLANITRQIDSNIAAEQDQRTAMRSVVEVLCNPNG